MSYNVVKAIGQSPPIDLNASYDDSTLQGKTILITGGASGIGAGFAKRWAACGANVVVGDINDAGGREVIEGIRKETGNHNVHYLHCDVTNWQSQVDMFHEAIKLSPTGGIDAVVANAGIFDSPPLLMEPIGLDADEPRAPNLKCIDVCLTGVLYTTHLALFYLPRNPNSPPADTNRTPAAGIPDRHLLLIGSVASFVPLTFLTLYGTAKHAVLGLFRSLRTSSFKDGVRVNMIAPWYIDTPLVTPVGRILLAGAGKGTLEDVVDAGTRLMADTTIVGRALVVGPKAKVDDYGDLLPPSDTPSDKEQSIWECYSHDMEDVDIFTVRLIKLFNAIQQARGWAGWGYDVLRVVASPFQRLFGR